MKPYGLLLVVATTLLFIISDSLAANWGKSNNLSSLFILFITGPIGYILFGVLNRDKSLAASSGAVNMGLLIGTILVSLFYFNESINLSQIIGLFFAFAAMYLLV